MPVGPVTLETPTCHPPGHLSGVAPGREARSSPRPAGSRTRPRLVAALVVCGVLRLVSGDVQAQGHNLKAQGESASDRPAVMDRVTIEQKLETPLPLDLTFVDEEGRTTQLGDYFDERPVVLALVYYECPMLCGQVLNGLTNALKTPAFPFEVGRDFDVVAVSFNPREGPELAARTKRTYVNRYRRSGSAEGWHFLTGDESAITALTDAVGFSYEWDARAEQYAHLATTILLTPSGRVSRYIHGIEPAPRDLRLGLVEASQHQIGTLTDQVLLYCMHYDPSTGRYGWMVMNLLRGGGALLIVTGLLFWGVMWRRERRSVYARILPQRSRRAGRPGGLGEEGTSVQS